MDNFIGKDGFNWWVGVVENRIDPLQMGHCQVRIFGYHTEDKSLIPTDALPWAPCISSPNASQSFSTPKEGDYVIATATLESLKNKVGFYIIEIKRENTLVALFKGVAYRTNKEWE